MFIPGLQPIPKTKEAYRSNELPICQEDIRCLAEVSEELAEAARFAAQVIRMQGGVNPNTIQDVYPNGRDGGIDVQELGRIVTNLSAWLEY